MTLTVSDTACAIHGLGPAAWRLDDFLQRVHPDELQGVRDTIHAALRTGAQVDVGYRIVRPSGEERHVRVCAEPLRADGGRTRYLGTVQDVIEQVRR